MRGDYTTNAHTLRDRMTIFLTSCMASGVAWRRAAIVAAVATPESGLCILGDREENYAVYKPVNCAPNRPPLALEQGSTRLGTKFPPSWKKNDALMNMLRTLNWVNGAGDQARGEADTVDAPQQGRPNNALGYIFEWLMDQRAAKELSAFSIGPTQMYLLFSPLTGGDMADRFPDWESLWSFYTAQDGAQVAQAKAMTYLPVSGGNYPTLSTSDEQNKAYLKAYQLGTVDWEADDRKQYYSSFKTGLTIAYEIGKALGYPSIG